LHKTPEIWGAISMRISNSISRYADFYRRHGFVNSVRRAGLAAKRAVLSNRMVVFYCDLADQLTSAGGISSSLTIDRLRSEAEFRPKDLLAMTSFWNPKQARRNISERFEQGASLWLIKSEDNLAGYGWSLQGRTVEPYYFPLGKDDIHLFDFHVFPQYRGRGINPLLVAHILRNGPTTCGGRAFIEAAEWNEAQLSSLRKTPFRQLGLARSFTIFGRTFVSWIGNITLRRTVKDLERKDVPATAGRPPGE
jgi:ribosomal protein S18 acetylase RimI-like enzyme